MAVGTVRLSLGLHVLLISVPFLQRDVAIILLNLGDWLLCTAAASSVIWLRELSKLVVRHLDAAQS